MKGTLAKYKIKHPCGHETTANLVGPISKRQWQINKMEQENCRECHKEQKSKEAAIRAEEKALPNLTGSDKQVAWAITIRDKALQEYGDFPELATQTSAKWWIDNRNRSVFTTSTVSEKIVEAKQWCIDNRPAGVDENHPEITKVLDMADMMKEAVIKNGDNNDDRFLEILVKSKDNQYSGLKRLYKNMQNDSRYASFVKEMTEKYC